MSSEGRSPEGNGPEGDAGTRLTGQEPSPKPSQAGRSVLLLRRVFGDLLPAPLWVLILVLVLTVAATMTVRDLVRQQQLARFEREVSRYQSDLRQRFEGYSSLLAAVRASWEAVEGSRSADARAAGSVGPDLPGLSNQQFGRLIAGLDLNIRYPGLTGVGYAPVVPATGRTEFARRLPQLAGDPQVRLHPTSQLPRSVVVTYLAQAVPNPGSSVLGYDMYSDPVRRQAIDEALRSGRLTGTGQLTLLNVSAVANRGLILYLPLRAGGVVTGLLYAPLQISAVLPPSVSGVGQDRLELRVSLDSEPVSPAAAPVIVRSAGNDFRQTETLSLAGRTWTLAFRAAPGFGRDAAASISWLVLAAGTLVSLLAALATQAQVAARQRAEQTNRSLNLSQSRLERSRAEFEAVFRAMQDTAVFTDPAGRVLFANEALRWSFGLNPYELRGSMLSDLHADPRLLSRLEHLPGPQLVSTLFRRRGGETFYGEMQRSLVVGEGGEVLGQLEVIRDVSDRLQADRALRQGERRYQGVLEGMPQIVFLTDAAGQVGYLNRRWWEYAGQQGAAEGDLSASLTAAVHPDDRADFSRRWQEALTSGRDLEVEHRLRSGSGLYRTFVTRSRPIRGAQGQILEWVGSSTDIDDQIYAEINSRLLADVGQALNDRQPQTDTPDETQPGQPRPVREPAGQGEAAPLPAPWAADPGLQQALELITVHFADSAVLWPGSVFSDGGEAAQGEESDGPVPLRPLSSGRAQRLGLLELAQVRQLDEAVSRSMHSHEPSVFGGRRLHPLGLSSAVLYPLTRDDQTLGVLGLGFRQPLQDRDLELGQELAQRLTSALDNRHLLVRLQLARESLQELNDSLERRVAERTLQLSEANSELEAFSYSVSHDLRTPLRHIMGFADLLRRETGAAQAAVLPGAAAPHSAAAPNAKAERYLKVITESAERMNHLIDDLLEFSRTSRAELRRGRVDLAQLVQDARADLAPDQQGRQVQWQVGPLPSLIGDAGLLRQVIDNLLSNALKYTRTRPTAVIEVAAEQQDREIWLSVRDNGVGFDPAYAGKLFGVFQRLHRNEEFEGTGIGLANVRRIVSRHGGRVWAESGQDARPGATFWVALPLEPLTLEKGLRPGRRAASAVSTPEETPDASTVSQPPQSSQTSPSSQSAQPPQSAGSEGQA